MVRIEYTTHAGNERVRHVPDAQIERAVRGMWQARIECDAYAEDGTLVGHVHQVEGAVVPDRRGGERTYNGLAWWCDTSPNPQEQIDEREVG